MKNEGKRANKSVINQSRNDSISIILIQYVVLICLYIFTLRLADAFIQSSLQERNLQKIKKINIKTHHSLRWFGHLLRWPPGSLLGEMHVQPREDHEVNPGNAGETIFLGGTALSWRRWLGEKEIWASLLRLLPQIPNLTQIWATRS